MKKLFSEMSIEDSPWIDCHETEDVANYIQYFKGLATGVVDLLDDGDTRTSGPFLAGAQQSVERYNITTRAHKITNRTTLRFSQLKDGDRPVTIFIIPDVSRLEAQRPVMELLQYCLFQEMKRHENKHALVHYIGDEINNFKINDLDGLLTWTRGYGVRFQLYAQNYPAFRKMYGKEALATLLSECEIILYLPSQREPETLSMIEKKLGIQSIISVGQSGSDREPDQWISNTSYREDGQALQSGDQIRRSDKAILFIRRNKAALVDLPPIGAVAPFRDMIDINPFHGKPFLLPITLRLNRDKSKILGALTRKITRLFKIRKREPANQKLRLNRMARIARLTATLINGWALALVVAFALSPIGPHLRTSYQYREYGANGPRTYLNCTYLGSRGFIKPDLSYSCPLLIFIDSKPWSNP